VKDKPFSCRGEQWDLSIEAGKQFLERLLLYSTFRYSEIHLPYTHYGDGQTERIGGFREKDNLGVSIGAEMKFAESISVRAEKSFLDEDSYALGIYITF